MHYTGLALTILANPSYISSRYRQKLCGRVVAIKPNSIKTRHSATAWIYNGKGLVRLIRKICGLKGKKLMKALRERSVVRD